MKQPSLRLIFFILSLTFTIYGCDSKNDVKPDEEVIEENENFSLIGEWLMEGTTKFGLDFKTNGVVVWKHRPYMSTDYTFRHDGNVLIVEDTKGKVEFSDNGKTIVLTGFGTASASGSAVAGKPSIDGKYMKQ